MGNSLLVAAIVGIGLFLLIGLLGPKLLAGRAHARTRNILDRMTGGAEFSAPVIEETVIAKPEVTGVAGLLVKLPGGAYFYDLMLKAGHQNDMQKVVLGVLGLFIVFSVLMIPKLGILSLIPAALFAYVIPMKYFKREIDKRNREFINQFPEAIDMIVRSVKSGHPLNAAMRMIADNMESPIREEFRQVINEVSYGRPLVEALKRMSQRIDEPDVNFFVVVLSVQQETGGNLAEILSNLSHVIRGRKKLKQKIRALTSEGRATSWILGALPIVQFLAVYFTSPSYLQPLFTTFIGNIVFGVALGLIFLALWIVRQMIDVDI